MHQCKFLVVLLVRGNKEQMPEAEVHRCFIQKLPCKILLRIQAENVLNSRYFISQKNPAKKFQLKRNS